MSLTIEQKRLRKTGITASDAAAIVGVGKFKSMHDVYLDKVAELDESEEDSEASQEIGNAVEAILLKRLGEHFGVELEPAGTVVHPTESWIIATPDAYVVKDGDDFTIEREGVGEVKFVGSWMEKHWQGQGGAYKLADYVGVQGLWQQIATVTRKNFVAAAFGTRNIQYFENHYQDKAAEALQDLCWTFYSKHVLKRVPPPVDASESASRMLRTLYPKDFGEVRAATPDEAAKVAKYVELGEQVSKLEKERDEIGNEIRAALKELSGLELDGYTCTFKATDKSVSWKKVAAALKAPTDVVAKFSKPGPRRLLITRTS